MTSRNQNGHRHGIALVLTIAGILGFVALVMMGLYGERIGVFTDYGLTVGHFPAVVGLPLAAGLSLLIVLLLPQAYGRIEFKAVGLTFKGAAGPVVLWLFCFLGIVIAIRLVW